MEATMHPFVEVFFRSFPAACGAHLAGLLGIHLVDLAASVCCFARDDLHELSQPIVQDALVQASFGGGSIGERGCVLILFPFWTADQVSQVQVFKDDHLVLLHELLGLLVMEITATVGHLAMGFCYLLACFLTARTPSFLAGQGTLLALQLRLGFAILSW
jgi:hypothetical protein